MDLKRIRTEMDLTQEQLAKKAKLSIRTVARMERTAPGEGHFNLSSVVKLRKALKLSPEEVDQLFDLLVGKPEQSKERTQKR